MSVAWTTLLVIVLLFPGVFFFVGLSFPERFSREVVRSNAIGDVGLAVWVALSLHLAAYGALTLFGFDLAAFLGPLLTYEHWASIKPGISVVVKGGIYTVLMAVVGFLLGLAASKLTNFARHKWITVVNQSMREGLSPPL